MARETIYYVNHKPRKRVVEDLGAGWTLRKIGKIPQTTFVYVKYFEDEGRQPYFVVTPRGSLMNIKVDPRYIFLSDLDMEGFDFINRKIKEKRKK